MLNIPDAKSKIEKVLVWSKIRYYVWKTIRKEGLMKHTFYIPTADTLLAMGPRTKRLHYILNLYELFDGTPMYLKNLKEYALKASLITCPDLTRAHILEFGGSCLNSYGYSEPPVRTSYFGWNTA